MDHKVHQADIFNRPDTGFAFEKPLEPKSDLIRHDNFGSTTRIINSSYFGQYSNDRLFRYGLRSCTHAKSTHGVVDGLVFISSAIDKGILSTLIFHGLDEWIVIFALFAFNGSKERLIQFILQFFIRRELHQIGHGYGRCVLLKEKNDMPVTGSRKGRKRGSETTSLKNLPVL